MSDIRIVNLSNYTTPKVVERKNKEWVEYGEDNDYFRYLIDRYNGSATNNAIINGLSEMIYGKGLSATDSSRKPEEYAKMMSLFTHDCMRKVVFDLKLMGQATLQVIYSKDRKSIAQVEHFPIETLRMERNAIAKGISRAFTITKTGLILNHKSSLSVFQLLEQVKRLSRYYVLNHTRQGFTIIVL